MRTPSELDRKQKPAKKAAPRRKAGAEGDRIVAVLRAFSVGQYGGRLDLAQIADPGLLEIAKAVNATADHVEAEIREAFARLLVAPEATYTEPEPQDAVATEMSVEGSLIGQGTGELGFVSFQRCQFQVRKPIYPTLIQLTFDFDLVVFRHRHSPVEGMTIV